MALKGVHTPDGSGEIWLDNVRCSGNETKLMMCAAQPKGMHNCDHDEDAGILCLINCECINTYLGLYLLISYV